MANPNIIPYLHYQDIQIPDITTRTQFKTYWNQAQYSQAINLLTSSGLSGKAYLAEVINTLTNGVSYMEAQYDTNVTGFLASALNHRQFLIDSFVNRYVWNQSVSYVLFNFVNYNSEVYMALGDVPVGTLPTDTTYWLHVPIRGEAGSSAINLNLKYVWDDAVTYEANDVVSYDNKLYVALVQNVNVVPNTDENTWILLLNIQLGEIVVSLTEPENPEDDDIWLQPTEDPSTVTETTAVFKSYDGATSAWVEMYPYTFPSLLANQDALGQALTVVDYDISTDEWINQGTWETIEAEATTWFTWEGDGITWQYFEDASLAFIYESDKILASSVVKILPQTTITEEQDAIYKQLAIGVDVGKVVLATVETPTVNIPIRILIQ